MEQRQPIERQWAQDLSEIIGKAMQVARSQGRDMLGGDNEWEECSRVWETENMTVEATGDEESGPYRLTVYARTTEGSGGFDEPLLRLEIRPAVWWINEVRAAIADPRKVEKTEPVAVH